MREFVASSGLMPGSPLASLLVARGLSCVAPHLRVRPIRVLLVERLSKIHIRQILVQLMRWGGIPTSGVVG